MKDLILKLARDNSRFRRNLIYKLAEEDSGSKKKKGMPPGFKSYWDKVWENGKKKVKNPNPKGRKAEVTANTAMKDKSFRKTVMEDFKKWNKKNGDKDKGQKGSSSFKKDIEVLSRPGKHFITGQETLSIKDKLGKAVSLFKGDKGVKKALSLVGADFLGGINERDSWTEVYTSDTRSGKTVEFQFAGKKGRNQIKLTLDKKGKPQKARFQSEGLLKSKDQKETKQLVNEISERMKKQGIKEMSVIVNDGKSPETLGELGFDFPLEKNYSANRDYLNSLESRGITSFQEGYNHFKDKGQLDSDGWETFKREFIPNPSRPNSPYIEGTLSLDS